MTVPARLGRARDLLRHRAAVHLAVGVAGVLAVAALDPGHRDVPLCPLHASTGLLCPLCGGLRAVDALAHLHVVAALHDNVLVVAGVLPWSVWRALRRRDAASTTRRQPRWFVPAVITVGVAFAVVRNLPFATGLRPG